MDTLFPIASPIGILVVLTGVPSLFLGLEKWTRWRLFNIFPPLLFIYAVPMILSSSGVLATQSPVYDWMDEIVVPLFLVLMLLEVEVVAVGRIMGRGILVMLLGSAGVVLGAPVAYFLVKGHLDPGAWKAFGILAGSWIGGSGNMAAMARAWDLPTSDPGYGLAVLADTTLYAIWIPILLASKSCAGWFNRFTRVDPRRMEILQHASAEFARTKGKLEARHVLYLLLLGLLCAWVASGLAACLPSCEPVLTASVWRVLIVTVLGILLSTTPAKRIPGSREVAVALVYLFVAKMGAGADVSRLAGQALWFLAGAALWISIHGAFCVLGARWLHVDIHTTAIASAANIGGVVSASIVAAYHNDKLVPVSILMALLGYALGNFGAWMAGSLCYWVS